MVTATCAVFLSHATMQLFLQLITSWFIGNFMLYVGDNYRLATGRFSYHHLIYNH